MARPRGSKNKTRRVLTEDHKRQIGEASKRRWQASREPTGQKMGRARTMSRNAAARLRYAKKAAAITRTEKWTPQEKDARNAGASIIGEKELRRPTFVVITPQGRRIETLEPDIV